MVIPIIPASEMKKEKEVSRIPIIPAAGVKEFRIKEKKVPTGVRPVIPIGDTCCTKVCKIINDKVEYMENELRLREAELASITEGLLIETKEVTKRVPVKVKGKIVKGRFEEIPATAEKRVSVSYSQSRLALKRQTFALTNQLSTLKDMRYEMLKKGSCKCIEEVKYPERKIPEE